MTTKLDVRPMLAAGEEPFSTIMSVVDGMSEGERFELVAPFDPVPCGCHAAAGVSEG